MLSRNNPFVPTDRYKIKVGGKTEAILLISAFYYLYL